MAKKNSGNTTTSSNAARDRHNEKTGKKGGKAGCQGNFHGQRAEVIDEYYPEFLQTKGRGRKIQAQFWAAFFGAWWKTFQWNLPLDRDPDPSFPPPPEETEEILAQKTLIIKLTEDVSRMNAYVEDASNTPLAASQGTHALPRDRRRSEREQPLDRIGRQALRASNHLYIPTQACAVAVVHVKEDRADC